MCGINGIVGFEDVEHSTRLITKMNDAIAHRGPDDSGAWATNEVVLGHRRLAIIDLSKEGHQPMISNDKRYIIVYNGELYNYRELKNQLKDFDFETNTDTEVILASYSKWGKDCVKHFNGMFAFFIWDTETKSYFAARDRLGIKPFYYYISDKYWVFSSEIKGILASELVPRKINKAALPEYLTYQTVHAPNTMLEGVYMLEPGNFITGSKLDFRIAKYWDISTRTKSHTNLTYQEVTKTIKEKFIQSVESRLVADVPFGAFLSGGIDSTAVVGAMSKIASKPISTFSVTFAEEKFSEAKYARLAAKKHGTDHHEIKLTPEIFLENLPNALKAIDHPSGDGPNTYIVSKVTKEAGITMALSGLGGDELFAGYDIFRRASKLKKFNWITNFPLSIRKLMAYSIEKAEKSIRSEKIAQLLLMPDFSLKNIYGVNRQVLSRGQINKLIDRGNNGTQLLSYESNHDLPFLSQVSVAEIRTYMQNVLLRDTDQMSMAHALEIRVPFLDHNLIECVLGIEDQHKYPHSPKKLLTDSLSEFLLPEIVNRPKMGFVLPWALWLKRDLKSFCEDKISNLETRGLFIENELTIFWKQFLKGNKQITWSRVWPLIVLENWLEEHDIG